ncbi:hypothetical protein F4808DRAFT_464902 [Astrocystis sublimbata]|nr:hypothetical protein F4808DRAFT_464902 [Astrocystis sublimbata]
MSDEPQQYSGALRWFASDGPDGEGPAGWRLDVVTLLAVIGESSVAEHSQVITSSVLCLLPRIIPAPQALLKPSRPQRLPETTAKMTGVYSGVVLDTVGFFANIIHPLDELQPFAFKVMEIKHRDRNTTGGMSVGVPLGVPSNGGNSFWSRFLPNRKKRTNTMLSTKSIPGPPSDNQGEEMGELRGRSTGLSTFQDIESGPEPPQPRMVRSATMKQKVQDFVANPTLANNAERPAIPARLWSPMHILEVFSALLTYGILAFAIWDKDGTAIFAVALMAFASSVVGWASWWRPILMNRAHTNKVPQGDVIIRTREGGFLLVRCTEEVARELYSGTEECEYRVSGQLYRVLMGLGTILLMIGVILLGNCKWYTQIFIGGSYIVLNALYWTMGLLPKHLFWDLSRYEFNDVTPVEAMNAEKTTDPNDPREGVKSFTRTLWFAIRETKKTAWVTRGGAAPRTPQWEMWLAEAEAAAMAGNMNWPAVARKDDIMKMDESEVSKSPVIGAGQQGFDAARQAAPATQVQPVDRGQTQGVGAF